MGEKIFPALCSVMKEIGAIGKDSRNKQQGYQYRGVDAVYNALQPALINNHIIVIPEVLEQTRQERCTGKGSNLIYSILKVKFYFYADDGSCVSATVIGEGMDSGDKASNKAMSVAFKYACFQVFCIPTEEMKDPDEETPEPSIPTPDCINEEEQSILFSEINRTGTNPEDVLSCVQKKASNHPPQDLKHLTKEQFFWILKILQRRESKKDSEQE